MCYLEKNWLHIVPAPFLKTTQDNPISWPSINEPELTIVSAKKFGLLNLP